MLWILFGFKSCGKTHYGKRLAAMLKLTFIDTDRLIEELYEKRHSEKLFCKQIYQKEKEQGFRFLEKEALLTLEGDSDQVIALGGGSLLDADNQRFLQKIGKLIYLKIDKDLLKARLLKSEIPAFLDPEDLEGSFEKMYETRAPIYEKLSDYAVSVSSQEEPLILKELYSIVKQELLLCQRQ